ncbi:MAG: hypothetical protein IPK04_04510 [Bdellovibrionales bacterium]|nr:hypothetical protein [Bdellovibrionales bacterium]
MAETTTRPVRSEEHSVPSEKETNDFYKVLAGHIFFQSLSAAVQFSLFDLLQKIGPSTEEEIAKSGNRTATLPNPLASPHRQWVIGLG